MRVCLPATLLLLVVAMIGGLSTPPGAALAQGGGCGGPRSAISTLSDPGAGGVSLDPIEQQVVDLANWPAAAYLPSDARAGGIEMHTYAVTAELIGSTLQPDGDLDLILAQPGDERWTLIAVVHDPARCALAASSPQSAAMQAARSNLVSTLGVSSGGSPRVAPIVRVTGAGFLNPLPGGPGEAANGLELAPVLGFTLVGPAALKSFPVLPPGAASVPPPGAGAPPTAAARAPGSPIEPPASSAEPAASSVQPGPAPAIATASTATAIPPAVLQQQISDALASSAPAGSELPPPFTSAVLAAAGPGSGPSAGEFHLDFLLISAATGQPGAVLKYAVYASPDDAKAGFGRIQTVQGQPGAPPTSPAGQRYPTVCAPVADPSFGAPCAILVGQVVVAAQAGDPATALAVAQAGAAHLVRIVPMPPP